MYQYDGYDQSFVETRAREFRDQLARRVKGELSEAEFKPLRLMNGLYLQLHSYMLRVAIPYGVLSSTQLRKLAFIAGKYDRGYGHFTTRQNIQYNWPKLSDVPDILDHLAAVGMHAMQTSGNCIRNITSDPFAGVAGDEWEDPRPSAELLRQWSALHPEFAYLPRKFKFAITGASKDRTALKFHDLGLWLQPGGEAGPLYDIWVGGGQGRIPRIARLFAENISLQELLPMLDSMLRIYNLEGRRDNKYKARIKILIDEMGLDAYRDAVKADMQMRQGAGVYGAACDIQREYARIAGFFAPSLSVASPCRIESFSHLPGFRRWAEKNVATHKIDGYAIVSISLKPEGGIPGDMHSEQMETVATLGEQYSRSEIRITHRQNLVLPYVKTCDLGAIFTALGATGLVAANIDHASDIISCPGLDYCTLATARSIPIAQELSKQLYAREKTHDLSGLSVNISGCINACGHHHAANIGILGLNRAEQEYYQISLGGRNDRDARVGEILGPGFSFAEIPQAVTRIVDFYLAHRRKGEDFATIYDRLGKQAFREAVYVDA